MKRKASKPQYRHSVAESRKLDKNWVVETIVGSVGNEVDIVQTTLYNGNIVCQNAIHLSKKTLEKIL